MKLMRTIRQLFCRHTYRLCRFQALNSRGDYECVKCGKREYDQ